MSPDHSMSHDIEMVKVENRTASARIMFNAKLDEYLAILSVGSPRDREHARNQTMFALEAMMDLQEEHMCAILLRQGINPMRRHHRMEDEE